MKLTYDPSHNIAYIAFRERVEGVTTIEVSEDVRIDLAPDGTLYGIELLDANTQLRGGVLQVVNEASGRVDEVRLAG